MKIKYMNTHGRRKEFEISDNAMGIQFSDTGVRGGHGTFLLWEVKGDWKQHKLSGMYDRNLLANFKKQIEHQIINAEVKLNHPNFPKQKVKIK